MISWLDSWDQARAQSSERKQPIFLFLFSPT